MSNHHCTLNRNDIDIWLVHDQDIHQATLLSQYHQLLNEEETAKQQRFHFPEDRHQYLLTRTLLRQTLSYYHPEISPDHWAFYRNNYGKPYIANKNIKDQLYFNLSHTKGLIALAVSQHDTLGIDIESTHRGKSPLDIAEHYFSPQEVSYLFSLPSHSQRLACFFEIWTLKEAYIKALGMGLSIPLDSFSFSYTINNTIHMSNEQTPANSTEQYWSFYQLDIKKDIKAALAIGNNQPTKTYNLRVFNTVPMHSTKEAGYHIVRQS